MVDWNTINNSPKPTLTPNEEKFFIILNSILNDKYIISYKTKFSIIAKPAKWLSGNDYDSYNKMEADFVIYDKEIPSIVKLVIEYDDPSHSEEDVIKRDTWKNEALKKSNITISRFDERDSYQTIKKEIEKKLNSNNQIKEKVTTKNEVYIDNSQIYDTEQPEKYNNNSIWNKSKEALKEFLVERVIPAIIGIAIIIFIGHSITSNLFQNTLKNIIQQKTFPKNPINIPPSPLPPWVPSYENKILIPSQPPPSVKENIINTSPKIKVKVRITGRYISENKSFIIYERIDTRKQRNVTIEDFLKMCECSATELYTDRLMEIVEYP